MAKRKQAKTRRLDPRQFAEAYVEAGENGTEAIRQLRANDGLSPGYLKVAAHQELKKPEVQDAIALVKQELDNYAQSAVQKVGELVNSDNEVVAGQNARFIIEHVKGKPISQSINTNLNIYEAVDSLVMDADAPEAEIVDA